MKRVGDLHGVGEHGVEHAAIRGASDMSGV